MTDTQRELLTLMAVYNFFEENNIQLLSEEKFKAILELQGTVFGSVSFTEFQTLSEDEQIRLDEKMKAKELETAEAIVSELLTKLLGDKA
ncbi:hypothetical protein ACIU4M_00610 [Bacillus altitudinis]|uniref:hypothetical protein n=1 Tax=Bacillus altitudinis TaxID=293387 RepID=UPI00389ACBE4